MPDPSDYERMAYEGEGDKKADFTSWPRLLTRLGLTRVKAFEIPSDSIPGKSIQYYYAYCKRHGYYVGYEHGFNKELRCPTCVSLLKCVTDVTKDDI